MKHVIAALAALAGLGVLSAPAEAQVRYGSELVFTDPPSANEILAALEAQRGATAGGVRVDSVRGVRLPAAALATGAPKMSFAVTFDFDSAELTPEERTTLDSVAAVFATDGMRSLRLVGHADTTGTEAYNAGLSTRRARAARAYLISAHGIPPSALDVMGLGEAAPLPGLPGDHPHNRRVEFWFESQ